MSIVSSSHTPQGRGEEKGANYKWPHPVLPDFSGRGIEPRFFSAQAALRQDPPRLPGAPRCHEVRGEEARSRPPAGRGPGPLPGAPRLTAAVSRGHRARAPPLPAAAANGAHIRGAPCPGAKPGGAAPGCAAGARAAPGGREGHGQKSLSPAQASNLPPNGGDTPPQPRGFQSAFSASPPTREDTRTSSISPLLPCSPLPADVSIPEGE